MVVPSKKSLKKCRKTVDILWGVWYNTNAVIRGDTQGYQTLTLAVIWTICEDLVLVNEPGRPK